jgi:hypothetical protein
MGLRSDAYLDLQEIVHDTVSGGYPCTITSPGGTSVSFQCFSNDIHVSVDPGTGDTVTERRVTVSVLISDLIAEGFDSIRGVPDTTSRPWTADINDIDGRPGTYKVVESYPDRGIGMMVLLLERYERGA